MKQSIVIGKSDGHGVHIDVARLLKTRALVTANSGGGKSWLLRLMFEQLGATTQLLVLDREGEFVTLREKLDVLIVGPEGEIPADVRSAPLLVRRLLEKEISAVIDMSEMKIDGQREYVRAFLGAMIELPKTLWHPCFVGLDETHLFAPEKGEAKSADAVIGLATLGRKRGFASIYATQRISKLHKDAAAELLNKFIGRTTLDIDQDRAADELGMSRKDARPILREMSPIGGEGEFFGFGPALSLPGVFRMRAGKVHTTHPEAGRGQALTPPKPSSTIKAALAELNDLPKQAEAEIRDLATAQARIRELERAVKSAPVAKSVEVSSKADKAAIVQLRKGLAEAMKLIKELEAQKTPAAIDAAKVQAILQSAGEQIVREVQRSAGQQQAEWSKMKARASDMAKRLAGFLGGEISTPVIAETPARIEHNRPPPARREPRDDSSDGNASIGKCERAVLSVLAQHPEGCEINKLAMLAGYRVSGGFRNSLTDLRKAGYMTGDNTKTMTITDAGVEAVGNVTPLPKGEELREYWLSHDSLGKCERAVLSVLIHAHPVGMKIDELAKEAGYEVSGGFRNSLTDLRKAGVMVGGNTEEMRASDHLFE